MPGSGKTIIAVYLMKYLADSEEYAGKQIGFVVPQTSLRKTMKIIFRSIYGLSPSQVLSPSDVTKKKYDILLVDEAHRLHQYKNISYMGTFKANCEKLGLTTEADELDWILMQSKQAVLFYDSMQVVGPSGIDFERLQACPQTQSSFMEFCLIESAYPRKMDGLTMMVMSISFIRSQNCRNCCECRIRQ